MNPFEELRAIVGYHRTARFALEYLSSKLGTDLERRMGEAALRPRDLGRCLGDLESTYVVRLFARFEYVIRQAWRRVTTGPEARRKTRTVKYVMNRLAARFHMESGVLERANSVRRYRNGLVHAAVTSNTASVEECCAVLNRYLGRLDRNLWATS